MIKTKLIKNKSSLSVFRDKYVALSHNQVDLDYFESSKVRIFFADSEENIIAGYCICSGPNYRTFLPLLPSKLKEVRQQCGFEHMPPHEITCLFIEEKRRKSAWVIYFFLVLSLDILRLPQGAFIFGTHGKNINNYFCLAFPKLILYDRLFVATKGKICDFWLRKGSKIHFFKALIVLSAVRAFFGNRALTRFRLWLDKRDKAKWVK
ncbi:Uncharacterised protein [Legionella beliardensis]|uniref:Uncharacterized protein n=1 Tax=Legionella beliardensis TaxID=91822 RepID=A0A378JPX4_9GAMM|nr:hypothetical protein [Legionella beliardensis]STX55656.1 Uncharacterised protein [Legionella beliardensis]